jgi:hypothetical protein
MDNPTTLLVAIMYVTIVTTGLVNVLMVLSALVGRRRRLDPVHMGWIVVLLLLYLNFFWETTAILEIEGWDFISFLAFIVGPILLLFATDLLLAPEGPDHAGRLREMYLDHSRRYFLLLCLVQAWVVGLDLAFGSVGMETWLTAATALVFILLMTARGYRVHATGLTLIAIAFVSRTVIQAF